MSGLKNWLRIKFGYEKKSSVLIIDPKVFKENEIKETSVWCWRCMKHIKVVVQCKNGEFFIEYIGCPHMKGSG